MKTFCIRNTGNPFTSRTSLCPPKNGPALGSFFFGRGEVGDEGEIWDESSPFRRAAVDIPILRWKKCTSQPEGANMVNGSFGFST